MSGVAPIGLIPEIPQRREGKKFIRMSYDPKNLLDQTAVWPTSKYHKNSESEWWVPNDET